MTQGRRRSCPGAGPDAPVIRVEYRHMPAKKRGSRRKIIYPSEGTCCSEIVFELVDGKLHNVKFTGGCRGSTQGLARMLEGCDPAEAHKRLRGIKCGDKDTSCPDQLAQAIEVHGCR